MCFNKVQHMMGQKTGCNRSRPVSFQFFDFLTNVATGNRKNSEFVQPQPVVRSFAVGFSPISVFFPVQRTRPANTRDARGWHHIPHAPCRGQMHGTIGVGTEGTQKYRPIHRGTPAQGQQ